VYKWSANDDSETAWGGKKSICNKFPETSPIVSVLWPENNPFQCVFALMEGKIKIGSLRSNKSQLLYSIESCTVSMALNSSGAELLSGHNDGSIYKFTFPTKTAAPTCSKLVTHSQAPHLLSWGRSICVGGSDSRLTFYDNNGNEEQVIEDLEGFDELGCSRDLSVVCFSPNGDSIVVGSFNMFSLFSWNSVDKCWVRKLARSVENMYSVTALTWKPNGSALALGTSCGLVDVYNAAYRHYLYKDAYDITYVSPTEALIHDKGTPNSSPIVIQSSYGEITKIDILPETGSQELRYIIGRTKGTLILCDMKSSSVSSSEIEWRGGNSHQEKFSFDAPNACMISHAGELSIVEVSA